MQHTWLIRKELWNPFASDADQRFDTKVKCLTGWVSFWVKLPTAQSKTPSNAMGGGGGGGGGGGWPGVVLESTWTFISPHYLIFKLQTSHWPAWQVCVYWVTSTTTLLCMLLLASLTHALHKCFSQSFAFKSKLFSYHACSYDIL